MQNKLQDESNNIYLQIILKQQQLQTLIKKSKLQMKSARATTAGIRNNKYPNISVFLQQHQNHQLNAVQKDKNQEYLIPRHQSRSAQGSRSQLNNERLSSNFGAKSQRKIESKVPILTSNSKQDQLKKRISKLGLQSFMKEIVLCDKISDPHFSSKVIHALNKTYLVSDFQVPKNQMPVTFGKRTLRESRRNENLKVQWNPEKQFIQQQFKDNDVFIPSYMFPRRQNQATRLIKNKQKKNIQLYRRNNLTAPKKSQQKTSSFISTNLDQNLKNFHLINRSVSQKWKKHNNSNNYSMNINQNSVTSKKSRTSNQNSKRLFNKFKNDALIFCKKARIYV